MRCLSTWAALLLALTLHGQHQVLTVHADTLLPRAWRGPFKVDSGQVKLRIAEVRNRMVAEGFLAANCDTCTTRNDSVKCSFHVGRQFRWARLSAGGVPKEIASATGFRERFYSNRPVTPKQVARLFEGLLSTCENHGFPFASVGLDSLVERQGALHATVVLDRGRLVTIDSVVVRGTARVNPRYLQAFIGIKPGDLYNEALVQGVDSRTRSLPFTSTRHPAYMLFSPEQAKLYLFLDAKRASLFNGILGLAQDPGTGKVRFTGDLDLKLRNALHHGEAIDLSWRSLQDRTQDLKIRFNYPFAFNTPFGADLGLKLFKRDTTFLEVNARAALEYLMGRGDKVRVFVNNKSSKRLGRMMAFAPGLADVKVAAYGIGIQRERFDYRFNPRKGIGLDIEASAGNKRSSTSTFPDSAVAVHRSIQYEINGQVAWHIPVGKRGTVRLAAQGGGMLNDKLYANELFRIGGNRSLRGMDEASIYSSAFAIGTVEYRFLFEENSNLFLFADQGWWEDQSRSPLLSDTPSGFGLGTSFETKAGIFSVSYALGRQFNNPVELRNGKVHFGFSSLF